MKMRDWLALTRYLVIIPVVACLLASTALFVYAALMGWGLVTHSFGSIGEEGAKLLSLGLIEMADLFLLGTFLFIMSLGLYELFIDDRLPLPHWLVISSFDDLKEKLVKVVIVVLAVFFLGEAETWDGTWEIFGLGAAVALLIAALTWFLGTRSHESR